MWLRTNQTAGITSDFKMDIISMFLMMITSIMMMMTMTVNTTIMITITIVQLPRLRL